MQYDVAGILLAGGQGQRMNWELPKQFIRIAGKSILEHSFEALSSPLNHSLIVVTVPSEYVSLAEKILGQYKNAKVIVGGNSRQSSTRAALSYLEAIQPLNVVIHDAARPFLGPGIVFDTLKALEKYEAVDVAIPSADTLIFEGEGFIQKIPDRKHLLRGQTPQGFRFSKIWDSYKKISEEDQSKYTDDCGILLASDPFAQIRIVEGSQENIKITDPLDLVIADELFRLKTSQVDPNSKGIDVKDRIAVIFGGSKGIGQALHQILLSSGCKSNIASRENGCDVKNYADINSSLEAARKRFGRIDYVINTSGILHVDSLSHQSMDEIDDQIDVNLKGAINVAKASYQHLMDSKGMLLNFASSSYTRGRANYVPYSACKAAIVNMTQGLAEEWMEDQIRVNCIVPGRTDTSMRRTNFYNEDPESLLSPYEVGLISAKVLNAKYSGILIRV